MHDDDSTSFNGEPFGEHSQAERPRTAWLAPQALRLLYQWLKLARISEANVHARLCVTARRTLVAEAGEHKTAMPRLNVRRRFGKCSRKLHSS